MKVAVVFFILISMQSCVILPSYSDIKTGHVLLVNKELSIPANKASVTIQYGKVMPVTQLELYYPRCWFISRHIKKHVQTIYPGEFKVTKVRETLDMVNRRYIGFPFASLSMAMESGASSVEYATEMDISSELQPDINRLICSHLEDPTDAEHLTSKQINDTLSGLAEIIMKSER